MEKEKIPQNLKIDYGMKEAVLKEKIEEFRKSRQTATNGEGKSAAEIAEEIELVPPEDEPNEDQEQVVPVSFESGGNVTEEEAKQFEEEIKQKKEKASQPVEEREKNEPKPNPTEKADEAKPEPTRSSGERSLDRLIEEGEEMKADLLEAISKEQDEEKKKKFEASLQKTEDLLKDMKQSRGKKPQEEPIDAQSVGNQTKEKQGQQKVEVVSQDKSSEQGGDVFFANLEDVRSFANKQKLEAKVSLEQSLRRAMEALKNEQGIVELKNADVPTIVISDLHARREFLAEVLGQKNESGETVFDLLKSGRVNLICVGDGMHSERSESWNPATAPYHLEKLKKELGGGIANPLEEYKKLLEKETNKKYGELTPLEIKKAKEKPELKAKWAEFEPELRKAMMDNEMVKSLGTMKMVMELKAQFPDSFHYTRGNHDDMDERISGFAKYMDQSSESREVKMWVTKNYGQDFLNDYSEFEESLPLMIKGGDKLVVSHTAPAEAYNKDQIISRDKDVAKGLMWTDNNKEGTSKEKVEGTLKNIGAQDAVWIIGHRPVEKGNYQQQFNGKLVQINNTQEHVVAVVNSDGSFDPEKNVHKLAETGGILAELNTIDKAEKTEDQKAEGEKPQEKSPEQLRQEVEDLHQQHVEAQRNYWLAKREFGMIKRIRLKLKLNDKEAADEYADLKERVKSTKVQLAAAEDNFKSKYREYSQLLVSKKRLELINKIEKNQNIHKQNEEQKTTELQDALRMYVIAENVVDFKTKEKGEDGQEHEVAQKISLMQDLNKKLLDLNQAKLEALHEKDRKLVRMCWDKYRKMPKKYKIMIGAAMAGTIAAGAALAGGASVTVAMGASALSMGKRTASALAGSAFGAYVYKDRAGTYQKKREENVLKSEKVMAERISEGKDVDLYSLMKDRLAQEKKDNHKALALAGVAGFTVGAGIRGGFGIAEHFGVPKPEISQVVPDQVSPDVQPDNGPDLSASDERIFDDPKIDATATEQQLSQPAEKIQDIPREDELHRYKPRTETGYDNNEKSQIVSHETNVKADVEKQPVDKNIPDEKVETPEVPEEQLTSEEYVKGIKMLRKTGRKPSILQDREYVVAQRSAKMGINYVPKNKLPDEIVEKILSEREKPEVQISPEEAEKLVGNEPQDRMTPEEYQKMDKAPEEAEELTGEEPQSRLTPEQYKEMQNKVASEKPEADPLMGNEQQDRMTKEEFLASQGVGEEYGGGYDRELLNENVDKAVAGSGDENFDEKINEAMDKGDFEFQLAKGDSVWSKLEKQFGGNEQRVAETINQFRKETAKGLIEKYGYAPKDAQNYIHWRFRNLQPGDTIALENGKLEVSNFVDKGNTDYFAKKFDIQTGKDALAKLADDDGNQELPKASEQEEPAEIKTADEFKESLDKKQIKIFENSEAKKLLASTKEPSKSDAPNSLENIGKRALKSVHDELGPPKKGETTLEYLSKYSKDLTSSQKRGIASMIKAA